MKANQAASLSLHAPRLALLGDDDNRENVEYDASESQRTCQRPDVDASAQVGKQGEDTHTSDRLWKEAKESLQCSEAELARIARDGVQARFDLEDDQARHATAQAQVGSGPLMIVKRDTQKTCLVWCLCQEYGVVSSRPMWIISMQSP